MFRRIGVVAFVFTAVAISGIGCLSCFAPRLSIWRLTRNHWVIVQTGEGWFRIHGVVSAADRVELIPTPNSRGVGIVINEWGPPVPPRGFAHLTPLRTLDGRRFQVPAMIVQWRSAMIPWSGPNSVSRSHMVRIPVWLLVVLLLLHPLAAYLTGPLRRRKRLLRGECMECGYSLVGLSRPLCPECGTPVDKSPRLADGIIAADQDPSAA